MLNGSKIAGGNPINKRVENDFYATNPKAVEMLLNDNRISLYGKSILEPCVGSGNIIEAYKNHFNEKEIEATCLDIVDRGYPNTIQQDFLTWKTNKKFDIIITNPPYSLAQDFIEKSFSLLENNGMIVMFLKIQFLEGAKRKEFFKKFPPKYVYVFRNRMATWNNGQPFDPKTGKKWATTICHAWFIWQEGSISEPIIRWL